MPYNRLKEKGGARDAAKNSFTFCSSNAYSFRNFRSGSSLLWFSLYDGARLALTTGIVSDRQGYKYENTPILPDQVTSLPLQESQSWLKSRINQN